MLAQSQNVRRSQQPKRQEIQNRTHRYHRSDDYCCSFYCSTGDATVLKMQIPSTNPTFFSAHVLSVKLKTPK